jgi:hypothetical protein
MRPPPRAVEKAPKLDGPLGANPPAIAAAGAESRIVQELSLGSFVAVVEGACRAVFHTRQTPVTPIVDSEERHPLPSLPADNAVDFGRRFNHARLVELKRLNIIEGLWFANADACRVPFAQVALECQTKIRIKAHGAGRTGGNAHFATDAQIPADHHPFEGVVPINRPFGAYGRTRWILTVLAGGWHVESCADIPGDDLYAGSRAVSHAAVLHGTGCFTFHAPCAFQGINGQKLCTHRFSPPVKAACVPYAEHMMQLFTKK